MQVNPHPRTPLPTSSLPNSSPPVSRAELAFLYNNHFAGIYDFCLRTCQDEDLASDAVQATFERLFRELQQGKPPANVKPWLYTVARRILIDEYRLARRYAETQVEDEGEELHYVPNLIPETVGRQPEEHLQQTELQELVWQAAASLKPDDYSLLDLYLRHGIDADALVAYLGVSKGAFYTRLSRLKDSLEQAIICLVLERSSRRVCHQLAALLAESSRLAKHQQRKLIWTHQETCEVCQAERKKLLAPSALFAALPMLGALHGRQELIWQKMETIFDAPAESPPRTASAGGPRHRPGYGWMVGLSAMLVFAVILWFVLLAPSDPPNVVSISHGIGVPSSVQVIRIAWSPQAWARAYAIRWLAGASSLPDALETQIPGDANGIDSPSLEPGEWYFHLRTQGYNLRWTGSIFLGPFIIVAPVTLTPTSIAPTSTVTLSIPTRTAVLAPSATLQPSATLTLTPTLTPTLTRKPPARIKPPPATNPPAPTPRRRH
jgi:RNA polymerase sigma factor (sigma-70 family)